MAELDNKDANKTDNPPANNNDNAGIEEVKSEVKTLTQKFTDFVTSFGNKKDEKKTDEKPPESPSNKGGGSDAKLEAMQEVWNKEKEEMLNKIANLEKTQADTKKDDDAKKIKKAIAKAKETGFILPDDKQGEEWLTNILSADFDGTMQKIESYAKGKKDEKQVITGDEQTKLARELAKQTMTNFY